MQHFFRTTQLGPDQVAVNRDEIYHAMLGESEHIQAANFDAIHTDDLQRMFDVYDRLFFDGRCRLLLADKPFRFRLSSRMTQTGAHTARFGIPAPGGRILGERFEIAISARLVLDAFCDDPAPLLVCGMKCGDRLTVLQMLFEHEMVHLVELLVWDKSRCGAPRFGSIASRFFAHTGFRHGILTRAEQVLNKRGIRQGDRVAFCVSGREYVGRVNRVTQRATVLVDDPDGIRYSDGRRYAQYHVPVESLQPVDESAVEGCEI